MSGVFGVIVILIPLLIIAALGGIGYFFWVKIRYRTARSNQALIITGPKLGDPEKETNIFTDLEGRSMKIIRGGGYRLRRFQTATPVNLTSFQLKLSTPRVYTNGGVPIVADAGGPGTAVDNGCGFKIPVKTSRQMAEEIRDAIVYLDRNRKEIAEMGARAAQRIAGNYTESRFNEVMKECYERAVSLRKEGAGAPVG